MIPRIPVWRVALLAVVWWVLTEGHIESWGIGLVSVALALAVSLVLLPPTRERFSLYGLASFSIYFARQSLKGGVQVALMAMSPRLDLRPGVVELTLHLPVGAGQVLLASTLNLLPGTLSVGLSAGGLRLHVLDKRRFAEAGVRDLEVRIARMLGLKLIPS